MKIGKIVNFLLVSSVIGVAISYKKLYLFHIALLLYFFLLFYKYSTDGYIRYYKIKTKLHYFFYLFFIWYAISLIWSINIVYSLKYLFYIFCGISISLTLVYNINSLKKYNEIFKLLSIIFIIEIFFCTLESFTNFRLPISPLSKYVTYFGRNHTDMNVNINILKKLFSMPTGFQWNPNNMAIVFLILSPFFLNSKKLFYKIIGLIINFILIIKTDSRMVLISFLLMLIFYAFFFTYKENIFIKISIFIMIFLLIFISLPIFINFFHLQDSYIYQSVLSLKIVLTSKIDSKDSLGARQELVRRGIEYFLKSPIIGFGGGGSLALNEKYGLVQGYLSSMHFFWLEVLVDSGILFFLIFIIWYFYIIFKLYLISYKTKNEDIKYYSKSLCLSFISFFIGSISASSVIYFFPMWIMYGLGIALINIFNFEF